MGWFDKKSWQLRRKIRDLQAELATADRDGKYVVEQGLFFAELQEMGETTLMVLGTANHLDSEEETIIRNFLERNGFTVEKLRLDSTGRTLAAVEIIPPQELTRRVARELKEAGYRLVDDSEHERESRLGEKVLTLSGIVRAISALFATFVNQLIINNEKIKMNMEGNRLLHWMPLIRDAVGAKAGQDLIGLCRKPFVDAYNHYYGQLGRMENPEILNELVDETPPSTDLHDAFDSDLAGSHYVGANDAEREATEGDSVDEGAGSAGPWRVRSVATEGAAARNLQMELDVSVALGNIYRSLIGASAKRRVRNGETVLEIIAEAFHADAACLLTRADREAPLSVQINSPGANCISTGQDGTVHGNTAALEAVLESQKPMAIPGESNGAVHDQAVVVPISLQGGMEGLVILHQPRAQEGLSAEAMFPYLRTVSNVFREFPDLLVPDFSKKPESSGKQ